MPLTESQRATIRSGYKFRIGLVALVCLGFGCWAIYDGSVTYPEKQRQYEMSEQLKEDHEDWRSRWETFAAENDLPENPSDIQSKSDMDIVTQFIMAGITFPIGLWTGAIFVSLGRRYIEADAKGIRDWKGRELAYSDLVEVDHHRWDSKGIAILVGDQPDRGSVRITLDDWKFEREPTVAIFMAALEQVDPEKHEEMKAAMERKRQEAMEDEAVDEAETSEPADASEESAEDEPARMS